MEIEMDIPHELYHMIERMATAAGVSWETAAAAAMWCGAGNPMLRQKIKAYLARQRIKAYLAWEKEAWDRDGRATAKALRHVFAPSENKLKGEI